MKQQFKHLQTNNYSRLKFYNHTLTAILFRLLIKKYNLNVGFDTKT